MKELSDELRERLGLTPKESNVVAKSLLIRLEPVNPQRGIDVLETISNLDAALEGDAYSIITYGEFDEVVAGIRATEGESLGKSDDLIIRLRVTEDIGDPLSVSTVIDLIESKIGGIIGRYVADYGNVGKMAMALGMESANMTVAYYQNTEQTIEASKPPVKPKHPKNHPITEGVPPKKGKDKSGR